MKEDISPYKLSAGSLFALLLAPSLMEEYHVLECLDEKLGQVQSGLVCENLHGIFLTRSRSSQKHLDGSK